MRVDFVSPRSLFMMSVVSCQPWHVIVKRYNGDDALLAEFKSVRSRAFFSSENWFRSHPGFLTLRAADGGYAPAKKLVQARDLVPFREVILPTRR